MAGGGAGVPMEGGVAGAPSGRCTNRMRCWETIGGGLGDADGGLRGKAPSHERHS